MRHVYIYVHPCDGTSGTLGGDMKDKNLKRLGREELLELLIEKTRENETLHSQLDEALANATKQ